MMVTEAVIAFVAVLGALSAPVVLCFYKPQLDILDEMRKILLKQRSGDPMISPIEFMQLERAVRGGPRYLGKNEDVMSLMFPKRYWFNCLEVVAHIAAVAALLTLGWRVFTIEAAEATMALFFGAVDGDVHTSIFLLAIALLVYIITVLLAFNQKKALRRRINELSVELRHRV